MKIGILFSSLIFSAALFLTSCKEDIELSGDAKETAVVYGLLNQADSIHYIKINRAFISETNSLITAQIPDSNYFQNVEATIKEVVNGSVTRTWTLSDTIIDNKEPGVFFAPEQKVYYFTTDLGAGQALIANSNTEYQLDVNINEGEFVVSGKTALLTGMSIQSPSALSSFTFASSNVSVNGYANTPVKCKKGQASVVDISLIVSIDEFIGGTPTTKSFKWRLADLKADDIVGNDIIASASGNTFYTLIRQNCTNNPAITRRRLKSIRVEYTGGSEELNKYLTINKPSSSLAQNKPTYTNLTATNDRKVVGLFSARNTVAITKNAWTQTGSLYIRAIDLNSTRHLSIGSLTGDLFFCSDNPADLNESFYCN